MTVTAPDSPMPALTLDAFMADASDLAALPQVVMQVINLTVDPKATASDLERVIGLDQAMAAKILTLANSSYYGLPRRISSLREAVVFLGFKTVRSMAMTITTFNLFLGKSDTPALARRALWRHSLDTAQCAKVIATRLRPQDRETFGTDEAFIAGLLHDVGKMVIDHARHALFVAITAMAQAHGVRFYEVEAEVLPFTHSMIGAAVATKWNLPPVLCETIAFHHTPRAAEVNQKLTATVSLANEIAHFLEEHIDAADPALESLLARSADSIYALRLTNDAVQGFVAACRLELDKGLSTSSFM